MNDVKSRLGTVSNESILAEIEHRDLAKGAFVNTLGIAAKVSKALYLLVVARFFGVDLLGLYLLAVASVDILSKVAGLGLDWGILRFAVQFGAQHRQNEVRSLVLRVLMFGCLISMAFATCLATISPYIAETLLHKKTPCAAAVDALCDHPCDHDDPSAFVCTSG